MRCEICVAETQRLWKYAGQMTYDVEVEDDLRRSIRIRRVVRCYTNLVWEGWQETLRTPAVMLSLKRYRIAPGLW